MTAEEAIKAGKDAHRAQYPNGCARPGHMCADCTARLGDRPHLHKKVGGRQYYKGQLKCMECAD